MTGKKRPEIYAPHIPAGVITARGLRELAERMERAGAGEAKLTGELIFVLGGKGLSGKDAEGLSYAASKYDVPGVRGVKVCSAGTFCNRNAQDVLSLALKLDEKFYGVELPMKLTIGVCGCARSCSEPAVKDVGIMAAPNGFKIMIGGNAGLNPSLAREFFTLRTQEEVIHLIGKIVAFCRENGRKMVRLGKLIEEKGEGVFRDFIASRA